MYDRAVGNAIIGVVAFAVKMAVLAIMIITITPKIAQLAGAHWRIGFLYEARALHRDIRSGEAPAYYLTPPNPFKKYVTQGNEGE